jgi:hypothetical protein
MFSPFNVVIDSYHPVAFEVLLLVNGLKQIFAFGFVYGIVPWVKLNGYQNVFGAIVGINCGIVLLTAVPLYFYGKTLRHKSAGWKVIM